MGCLVFFLEALPVLFILGGILYGYLFSQSNDPADLLCMLFLLGAGIAFGVMYIRGFIKTKQEAKEEQEKKQIREKQILEINQLALEGKWEFPSAKFYQLCREANVTVLDTEFATSKAKKIAEQLIKETAPDIELDNCRTYLYKKNLVQFLAEGKASTERVEAEELIQKKQPKDADPTGVEEVFLARAEEAYLATGCDKRVKMLEELIFDYDCKIRALRDGEKALLQVGMIYADQQQKESDWAIIGGIAEGIAGPAAGLAAAANTMANNAKIREHNAAVRRASMDIMSGVPNLAGDRYKLEEEKENIKQQLDEAENKVVLSVPSSKEIWMNIKLGEATVNRNPSGVLAIALPVTFKEAFALDVPDGVSMVVDGTIKGEVWFEDQLVGDVLFPLPLYGIPSNMTAEITLDGMCDRSVEFDGEYTVKIADEQNLWIMEA